MAKSVTVADIALQVREVELDVRASREITATLRRDVDDLVEIIDKQRDELRLANQEIALLRQRLDDHLKRVELWDNRRWGLIVLMAGALLSLASGLIVTLARK